jgi:hypothetical protein
VRGGHGRACVGRGRLRQARVHGVRRVRAEAGARAQGEADEGEAGERVGRARLVRAEADACGGRVGHVRDEQGAVVSRLSEVWLYYELCSLIFFLLILLTLLFD